MLKPITVARGDPFLTVARPQSRDYREPTVCKALIRLIDVRLLRPDPIRPVRWSLYGTIINAGAYTAVDKAETDEPVITLEGERAEAIAGRNAKEHNITLSCT